MIAIIRIRGDVGLRKEVRETLNRLRLRRKYACVVINPTKEQLGMIKKMNEFIAFGEIKKETFQKLLFHRAMPDKSQKEKEKVIMERLKGKSEEVAEEIIKGKKYSELGLKPFFRLHPPRKGIDSKEHFGVARGVLGNNKEHINKLIERML